MPESLFDGPLSPSAAEELAAAMKVLTHPTRLRIVSVLAARGPLVGSLLARRVPMVGESNIYHHLEILARAELVIRTKRGREVVNSVHRAAITELLGLLAVKP